MSNRDDVVLAIRLRQLGDVLAALDALAALKRAQPGRRIAFVADEHFHELLRKFDFIDTLLPQPPPASGPAGWARYASYLRRLRALRPSCVLDFHGNPRSALLTALSGAPQRVGFDVRVRKLAYTVIEPRAWWENGRRLPQTSAESGRALARHAGIDEGEPSALPAITVTAQEAAAAREKLRDAGVPVEAMDRAAVIGLNPGKAYPAKAWPEENFVRLGKTLVAEGRHVVLLWGPGEETVAHSVSAAVGDGASVAPRVTLAELPAMLKACSLIVTTDSGLKHLAVCARVPTVTLFGATNPGEWHMGAERDRVIWRQLSCSPCRLLECPFGAPCMTGIDCAQVLAAVSDVEATG